MYKPSAKEESTYGAVTTAAGAGPAAAAAVGGGTVAGSLFKRHSANQKS